VARALIALAMSASAACGRFGFDSTAPDVDAGVRPTEADAAPMPDASVGRDASPLACVIVTTEVDERDVSESVEPPHQGSGLSLREAIELNNQAAGPGCIAFAGAMRLDVGEELPALSDPDGLSIDGGGAVHIAGPADGAIGVGLRAGLGPTQLSGLELSGFSTCLIADAAGSQLGPGLDLHQCRFGVQVNAPDILLRGVRVRGNSQHGVLVDRAAERTELFQVVAYDNDGDGIRARATTGLTVRHATLAMNLGAGLDARGGGAEITVLNSILSQNAGPGIAVDGQAALEELDFVDLHENPCEGCLVGARSITDDPSFTDPAGHTFTLRLGSPCADRGVQTELDTNGDMPGLFDGLAPDLGAYESN
jgi:hypothetical protein